MYADGQSSVGYQKLFPLLFEITKQINSGVELPRLLRFIAHEIVELTHADSCSIFLLDEDQNEILCRASNGLSPEEEDRLSFRMGEGITGWVASHGLPAIVANVKEDKRCSEKDRASGKVVSLLCVPLTYKNSTIGTVTATSEIPEAFKETDTESLLFLGNSTVQDIQNARLYRLSVTDGITKTHNRQYLYHKLPEEIERARRYNGPLSLIVIDVDHFTATNEKWGRTAGDTLLKDIASLLNSIIRDVDSICRVGGSQFVILLPHTVALNAMSIGNRLREIVEKEEFPTTEGKIRITISAGVAEYTGVADSEGFIRQAAEALHLAKSRGGNCVEQYVPFVEEPFEPT